VNEPPVPAWQLAVCFNCARSVPDGGYCGVCGAHLAGGRAARRHHAYAAYPSEHMLHLSVVSTLFPHLPHRHSAPFRIALLLSAALLLLLGLLRLTGPAIGAATILVPLVYLIYYWEVEVYEDKPLQVLVATFGVGGVVGILWAVSTGLYVSQTLILNIAGSAGAGRLIVAGLVFPLLAQGLMLVGPLALYHRFRQFDEVLDGFTFGAAAGLGFAATTTLVNLAPELRSGLFSAGSMTDSALHLLQRGILIPVLHTSTTGVIAAAIWLQRGRVRSLGRHHWLTRVSAAAIVCLALQVGLATLDITSSSAVVTVSAYAVVAAVLVLAIRVALHHMLLAEAVDFTVGPDMPCSHCSRIVPRMAFCPNCGIATRATPKTAGGRRARATR